jgi:hypothetical protein
LCDGLTLSGQQGKNSYEAAASPTSTTGPHHASRVQGPHATSVNADDIYGMESRLPGVLTAYPAGLRGLCLSRDRQGDTLGCLDPNTKGGAPRGDSYYLTA